MERGWGDVWAYDKEILFKNVTNFNQIAPKVHLEVDASRKSAEKEKANQRKPRGEKK